MNPLPTEEDVLAMLVLHAILTECQPTGPLFEGWQDYREASRDMNDRWPRGLVEIARGRMLAADRDFRTAIADSEQRLEFEQREAALVSAASAWQRAAGNPELIGALSNAVRTWRRALFALNPTVLDEVP